MPKQKTHRGAAKRLQVLPSGKIKRRRAFANHILEKKSARRKRRLSRPELVSSHDRKRVRRMLGV